MSKDEIKNLVRQYARIYQIDEEIALKQIGAESAFNPTAVSPAGAKGVAQFMPATARRFGLVDPFNVVQSLDAWGKYMSWLLARYKGDYRKALAGYNAGEGAVDKYKGVPPYKETQNYVAKILGSSSPVRGAAPAAPAAPPAVIPAPLDESDTSAGSAVVVVLLTVLGAYLLARLI